MKYWLFNGGILTSWFLKETHTWVVFHPPGALFHCSFEFNGGGSKPPWPHPILRSPNATDLQFAPAAKTRVAFWRFRGLRHDGWVMILPRICESKGACHTTEIFTPHLVRYTTPHTFLVGGFNLFEKYLSKWQDSWNRGENTKSLKPRPSFDMAALIVWQQCNESKQQGRRCPKRSYSSLS